MPRVEHTSATWRRTYQGLPAKAYPLAAAGFPPTSRVLERTGEMGHSWRAKYGNFSRAPKLSSVTQGSLGDLKRRRVEPESGDLLEDVDVYSYGLVEVAGTYTAFRFSMSVDHRVVCLDDPYPHPVIREAFPSI